MNILFIHQNFPCQFKFLAPALASQGHTVIGMAPQTTDPQPEITTWEGVKVLRYPASHVPNGGHPWLEDLSSQVTLGESCFWAMYNLKNEGFTPDIVIAHPGWGESLFVKDVWPQTKLGIYCEFFYDLEKGDSLFDPEFSKPHPTAAAQIRLKNLNHSLHLEMSNAGLSPTQWQASTFPTWFQQKIDVIHEGVDTELAKPNPDVQITISTKDFPELTLNRSHKIVTFVNRNLEPHRGYHIFMRALPHILQTHPDAWILIIGGQHFSYSGPPDPKTYGNRSWAQIFWDEVRPQIPPKLQKQIIFLGQVPYHHFISVLQLSTTHVYLTYPFVLSWSLIEAMSIACPIVASNTPPLREVIKDQISGKLVDFFDIHKLAHEVSSLLNDKQQRQYLGHNARSFVLNHYDKNICLQKQIQWTQKLADS
mgnify:CR=1 FL=1